jgi:hypothetical protein
LAQCLDAFGENPGVETALNLLEFDPKLWAVFELARQGGLLEHGVRDGSFSIPPPESGECEGPPEPPATLSAISRELGRERTTEEIMQELTSQPNRHAAAKGELFAYCEANTAVRQVMEEFGAAQEDLKTLYYQLLALGAGQWAGGHWVAASALAYPETLRYLLRRYADGQIDEGTAFGLIMYFERGAPLDAS